MSKAFYSREGPQGDSELVSAVISEALDKTKLPIDLTIKYLNDGILVVCNPIPPHHSSWNITWFVRNPQILDTGIDPILAMADPELETHLMEHMHRIHQILLEQCSCGDCRRVQRTTLKEWAAKLRETQ